MTKLTLLQLECLSNDILKRYLAGYLPEDSATQVEQHLSQCTECEDLMREIDSSESCDELLKPLQLNSQSPNSLESHCAPHSDDSLKNPATALRPWLPWMVSREVGPYELVEPLGHGGMGLVYLARHRKLDRLVAIKLLPAHHQTAEARVRFEREILAAGRLQHPAIVSATDAGQFGDMDYLVMEYVRGMDLGRLCKSIPTLSVEETCEIGRQIALGLSYAHAQGIVHRDIKPSNVILDDAGVVKILDFGLVLFDRWDSVSSELTTVGQFLGTLDYMAPEQAERCGAVDYRADLYALGATMFKLLCGRAPLAAAPNQSPIDKLRLLATHRPPSLKTLLPDAPEALILVVDRLLSTSPQERPASAALVAEDLQLLAKPGCLIELMAKARTAESIGTSSDVVSSKLKMPAMPHSNPPIPMHQTSDKGIRGNQRWLWIAAALVPLAFLAGYIIKLETPDGQFIIESDVNGAQVTIVKPGAETKTLKIETGNRVTRLSAGKYELVLESPSDGFTIDRDSFVIAKGDTVIARVRRVAPPKESSPLLLGSNSNSTVPQTSQMKLPDPPIYDGKTLDEWLDVARREKESKSWTSALNAIDSLTDAKNKSELYNEIFARSAGRRDFGPIAKWKMPEAFADQLLQGIERAASINRAELLKKACSVVPAESLDPVWHWLEQMLPSDPTQTKALVDNDLVIAWTYGSGLVSAINPWVNSLNSHVLNVAFKQIESDETNFEQYVAAISVVLRLIRSDNLTDRQIERIVTLLGQVWENRSTPLSGSYGSFTTQLSIGRIGENRQQLCIPVFFKIIEKIVLGEGQNKGVMQNDSHTINILSALANLELRTRKPAMQAWLELPDVLDEKVIETHSFNVQDFRLEDKLINQLPKAMTDERRQEVDELSVAYVLHCYASFLLLREMPTFIATPVEVGEEIAEIRKLDTNQNWVVDIEEQPVEFRQKLRAAQAVSFGKYLNTQQRLGGSGEIDLDPRMLEWAKVKLGYLDKDKNGRLSPDEFTGLDFSKTDTDGDGSISLEEFVVSRTTKR